MASENKLNNVRFQLDFGMIPKIFYKDPVDFIVRSRRVKGAFICALFGRYYEVLNPMYFPDNPKRFVPADFSFRELSRDKGQCFQIIGLPEEHEGSLEYCVQFIVAWRKRMFGMKKARLYALERTPLGLLTVGAMEPDGTYTTLGSNMFIPGFEVQLVGANVGEEVTVNVTFPEAYHAPNLAGKAAQFKCKIHEIRVKGEHKLDDTFAKEVGGCETFAEFRRKLAESMQAYTDDRGEMDLQDRLLRQAAQTLEFTISEKQLEQELEEQINNLKAQLAQQGLTIEMYCQFMNTTIEQLKEDARPNAVASIRAQAAIEQIVALENLTAEEEEINQAVAHVARQNNMTLEQLKPYYDAEFEAAIVRSVLTGKAMRLIRDNAIVTEI